MMYVPKSFQLSSVPEAERLIRDFPLATLITQGEEYPFVTHLPLFFAEQSAASDVLLGHMAKANPHWRQAAVMTSTLAVFRGPDHYVTPAWYPGKQEHGRVVPTWNYTAVHVYGTLEIITEPAQLLSLVETITSRMEAGRDRPWAVTDAPRDYIEKLLSAIVGCRLVIERMEAAWKLSQNRDENDYEGVRKGLLAEGDPEAAAVAQLMRRRS